jgi:hypothetical protein
MTSGKILCFNKEHTDLEEIPTTIEDVNYYRGDEDGRPPVEMEKWDERVPKEFKTKLQHWYCPKCDTQIATPR